MSEYILKFRKKISRRTSHDLILAMAKFSFRGKGIQFTTDASVKRYLKKHGADFKQTVEKCRIFKENVPYFENLIGSTWTVSEGAKLAVVDKLDGQKKSEVQGPGTLTVSTYWGLFEEALRARDRSVESSSYSDYQNAIVSGIASIEAYINHRAEIWNKINPTEKFILVPHVQVQTKKEHCLICPIDKTPMKKEVSENVILDRCGACGRVWLDSDELKVRKRGQTLIVD